MHADSTIVVVAAAAAVDVAVVAAVAVFGVCAAVVVSAGHVVAVVVSAVVAAGEGVAYLPCSHLTFFALDRLLERFLLRDWHSFASFPLVLEQQESWRRHFCF